ncbi:BLUF domain-containing protein [Actinokineospora guangxiensis]|uniref:BLUF domain-containing protein n=1 Tax=Actinokineospora guangxiensis TaxID=1490288 RepID=A0ABW0EH06_9PSEU
MLYTLIYSSVAAVPMDDDEVEVLLGRCQERNAADGVTGLLVHVRLGRDRAAFIQVLEGRREAVESTFARIERDELHEDVTVLTRSPLEVARFHEWSMKFAAVDEPGLGKLADGRPTVALLRDREMVERVITALGGR